MKSYLNETLLLDENEFINVLKHSGCGKMLDWCYQAEMEASRQLLERLDPDGRNSIMTCTEDKLKDIGVCHCFDDFPEMLAD